LAWSEQNMKEQYFALMSKTGALYGLYALFRSAEADKQMIEDEYGRGIVEIRTCTLPGGRRFFTAPLQDVVRSRGNPAGPGGLVMGGPVGEDHPTTDEDDRVERAVLGIRV